jgi:4-hydroxy-tetrahydrodipicolinate reductase
MPIRVLHVGLGPIGSAVARQVANREGFELVGAVDIDPAKTGCDIGDVLGLGRRLGVEVSAEAAPALQATKPDCVVHCTSSSLLAVMPQFETIFAAGVPVVSTTEELSYPYYSHRELAEKLDEMAKKAHVAILGTGVNPGFAMDALPIMLTGVCERVDSITVNRVQDARIRRLPFQKKIGAGLTVEQFDAKVKAGTVRHVGLTESIAMIADAMGWTLDRITDEIGPKVAETAVASDFLKVEAGYVCGIIQDGTGYRNGDVLVRLHMEAYLGCPESYDSVVVNGVPPLHMKVGGGFHGDIATASITANSIPKVIAAPPGLHTMRDLPMASYFGGRR